MQHATRNLESNRTVSAVTTTRTPGTTARGATTAGVTISSTPAGTKTSREFTIADIEPCPNGAQDLRNADCTITWYVRDIMCCFTQLHQQVSCVWGDVPCV